MIKQHDKKLQEITKKLSDCHNNKEFQEELKELKSKNRKIAKSLKIKIYTKIDLLLENANR